MVKNKNILIAIDNGIIALDVKRQLREVGYNAEIINLANKEKIQEVLNMDIQLIILEKSSYGDRLEYAARLAQIYGLPTIYLSTDASNEKYNHHGYRILMMPFGENELKEVVKIALHEK